MVIHLELDKSKCLLFKYKKFLTSRKTADNPTYACNRFCIVNDSLPSQFIIVPIPLFEHLFKIINLRIPVVKYYRRFTRALNSSNILNKLPLKSKWINYKQAFKRINIYTFSKELTCR